MTTPDPDPEKIREALRQKYPQFDERAYGFIMGALAYTIEKLGERRHLEASELADSVRELAQEKFGVLAREVLGHWGIRSTDDIGEVVYALVEVGAMKAREEDTIDQFYDLFDFDEAFEENYQIGRDIPQTKSPSR